MSNLIINGDFQEQTIPQQFGGSAYAWTSNQGISVQSVRSAYLANFNGINAYNVFVNLRSSGWIQQTVTTIPGQYYELSFDVGANKFNNTDTNNRTLNLDINGNQVFSAVIQPLYTIGTSTTDPYSDFGWQRKFFYFTALGSSVQIRFFTVYGPNVNFGPVIDNICLVEYAAPTPTPTQTVTPTQSLTSTPTLTPTLTKTPVTQTPTATPTLTPTITVTQTVTSTPGLTPSSDGTFSVFMRISAEEATTLTPTVTPTVSKTPNANPIPTKTPTPTPSPSASWRSLLVRNCEDYLDIKRIPNNGLVSIGDFVKVKWPGGSVINACYEVTRFDEGIGNFVVDSTYTDCSCITAI